MSDSGPPEPPVTTSRDAARLIALHFPDLAREPVERLGEGSDHEAFEVGGRYVFRFPKHDGDALRLASEARLVEWLFERLPIAIPRYDFLVEPSSQQPRAFAGYRMLPGTPAIANEEATIDLASIGARMGEFLAVLHSSDVPRARASGVPADDDPSRDEWSEVALSDLRFALDHGHLDPNEGARWERYLQSPLPAEEHRVCLLHGDLAAEHVLVDDRSRPVGVIDWSDACIGDPARDFAGLVHWGGPAMLSAARGRYGHLDERLLARARWLAACRAFADIVFGTKHDRAAYVDAGLRALAHVETEP